MSHLIVFRCDSSIDIGAGHITRCLALAWELREIKNAVYFISRTDQGNLIDFVEENGFPVICLPASDPFDVISDAEETCKAVKKIGRATWLIADRYGLDRTWDAAVSSCANAMLVVDDLAQTTRDCDILLNHNHLPGVEVAYAERIPKQCRLLLGPRYALVGRQFMEARKFGFPRTDNTNRILISFGGSDAGGETEKTLMAITRLGKKNLHVDVAVGAANPNFERLTSLAGDIPGVAVHRAVKNMAELVAKASLVVGALGTSTWERLCLGVPCLVVTLTDDQNTLATALATAGYVEHAGQSERVTPARLAHTIQHLLESPAQLRRLSERGRELVDGMGAKRVSEFLASGTANA